MVSYDNNREFVEQFKENYQHILYPIIKSSLDVIKLEDITEEERYDVLSTNLLSALTMATTMNREYEAFLLSKKNAKNQ